MKETSTQDKSKKKGMSVRDMVQIGMLGALSAILMLFQLPLWFAPPFYKLDFSEVPVLIGAFAMGPLAGILIELIKVLLNFVLNGTMTMGVGEFASFVIGSSFVVPAAYYYRKMHTKNGAIIGLFIGVIAMVAVGSILNAYLLLPAYAMAFGMEDLTPLILMGSEVNPMITNLSSFLFFAVAPFNLIKGTLASIITVAIYNKVKVLLRPKKQG